MCHPAVLLRILPMRPTFKGAESSRTKPYDDVVDVTSLSALHVVEIKETNKTFEGADVARTMEDKDKRYPWLTLTHDDLAD